MTSFYGHPRVGETLRILEAEYRPLFIELAEYDVKQLPESHDAEELPTPVIQPLAKPAAVAVDSEELSRVVELAAFADIRQEICGSGMCREQHHVITIAGFIEEAKVILAEAYDLADPTSVSASDECIQQKIEEIREMSAGVSTKMSLDRQQMMWERIGKMTELMDVLQARLTASVARVSDHVLVKLATLRSECLAKMEQFSDELETSIKNQTQDLNKLESEAASLEDRNKGNNAMRNLYATRKKIYYGPKRAQLEQTLRNTLAALEDLAEEEHAELLVVNQAEAKSTQAKQQVAGLLGQYAEQASMLKSNIERDEAVSVLHSQVKMSVMSHMDSLTDRGEQFVAKLVAEMPRTALQLEAAGDALDDHLTDRRAKVVQSMDHCYQEANKATKKLGTLADGGDTILDTDCVTDDDYILCLNQPVDIELEFKKTEHRVCKYKKVMIKQQGMVQQLDESRGKVLLNRDIAAGLIEHYQELTLREKMSDSAVLLESGRGGALSWSLFDKADAKRWVDDFFFTQTPDTEIRPPPALQMSCERSNNGCMFYAMSENGVSWRTEDSESVTSSGMMIPDFD